MEYSNPENSDKEYEINLKLQILRNQQSCLTYIFLYIIGIIIQVTALVNPNKNIISLICIILAPIFAIRWFNFTNQLYNSIATVSNRFGINKLYSNLILFWGNKKLPVAALFLSLVLALSSFTNYFTLTKKIPRNDIQLKMLLTLDEAQAISGLSKNYLGKAIENGKLKTIKIPDKKDELIKHIELEKYIKNLNHEKKA